MLKQRLLASILHHCAQIHYRDPVAQVLYHAQVVADEQVGDVVFRLHFLQQIHHLRLYADIQRADRFVTHNQRWAQGNGARNGNALPLTAGKLVRIAQHLFLGQTDFMQQLYHRFLALRLRLVQVLNLHPLADLCLHVHAGV